MLPKPLRLTFKIGDGLPADSWLAIYISAVAVALNDLLMVNKLYLRNEDEEGLGAERLYLMRLSASHLYELQNTIKLAGDYDAVKEFVERLPAGVRENLSRVGQFEVPWIRESVRHIRNTTFHYGSKSHDLEKLGWALSQTAEDEGEVTNADGTLSGLRFGFADTVANQQLARKFPEDEADSEADIDDSVQMERSRELFKAMSDATTAAIETLVYVVDQYLRELPDEVVVKHDDT